MNKKTLAYFLIATYFLMPLSLVALVKCYAVTIYNQSPKKLYVTIAKPAYITSNAITPVYAIDSQEKKIIRYHKMSRGKVMLIVDDTPLPSSFTGDDIKNNYNKLLSHRDQTIYLSMPEGSIKITTLLSHLIKDPLASFLNKTSEKISNPIKEKIKKRHNALPISDMHAHEKAYVRIGNDLCDAEKQFLARRKKHVHNAVQSLLPTQVTEDRTPIISCLYSGGGFRAVPYALGFLRAAKKTGLLDMVTYISAVSGSTLAVAGWMSGSFSLDDYIEKTFARLSQRKLRFKNIQEWLLFINALALKKANNLPLTVVDLFGLLLTNSLFEDEGNMRHYAFLSKQTQLLEQGLYPMPIYNAIGGDAQTAHFWYEFTPYEIGSPWLGLYIPSWASGRQFINGESVDVKEELSLSFYLGTFGSAFAATINKFYNHIKKRKESRLLQNKVAQKIITKLGNKRFTRAKMPNFTLGMKQSPLRKEKYINLADAGLACNLGYPPVSSSRRKSDIIIVVDASRNIIGAKQLRKIEQWAHDNGLLFPTIDYTEIGTKPITIARDEHNPDVPLVIYMPRFYSADLLRRYVDMPICAQYVTHLDNFDRSVLLKHPLSFNYNEQEAHQIAALSSCHVYANIQTIKDAIAWKTNQLCMKN